MRVSASAPLLCALAALSAAPAPAMVGGAPPAPALARTVGMLVGSHDTACTATVIARDLLLTVAHCVLPGAGYKLVDAQSGQTPELRAAATIARHPQFELKRLFRHLANADVALIKLAAPLSAQFAPAPLGGEAEPVAAGDAFMIAGYGVGVRGDAASGGVLRAAKLVAAVDGDAQILLFDPRTKGQSAGLGACTSDSGAPVFRDRGGLNVLVGIVSWSTGAHMGPGCGGLTGATALAPYRKWIVETAQTLGSPLTP